MYEEEAMDIYTEWSNANSSEEAIDAYTEQLESGYLDDSKSELEAIRKVVSLPMKNSWKEIPFEELRSGDIISIEIYPDSPHLTGSMMQYDGRRLTVLNILENTVQTIEDDGQHEWYFEHVYFCWRKVTPHTVPLKNNTLPEI